MDFVKEIEQLENYRKRSYGSLELNNYFLDLEERNLRKKLKSEILKYLDGRLGFGDILMISWGINFVPTVSETADRFFLETLDQLIKDEKLKIGKPFVDLEQIPQEGRYLFTCYYRPVAYGVLS